MRKRKYIRVLSGTISSVSFENGWIGLVDASGHVTGFNILPSNLYDTDGNRISIDELRQGDYVTINETGCSLIMRVLKIS